MTEWPQIFSALFARRQLQPDQTQWAMREILEDRATPAQIAAFAVLMRAKDETPEEIIDLLSVMLEHATSVAVPGPVLDVVGTGGDRAHTVNVSTMSAIVVAAAGARVVKHGNRAASSQSGSADVLEALGVVIDLPAEAVGPCLEQAGIAFCFAPVFHPALRFAGQARKDLAIPTFFNILGPLTNPAGAPNILMGVFHPDLVGIQVRALQRLGAEHALVVYGRDGMDEVSLGAATLVGELKDGEIREYEIHPEDFGLAMQSNRSIKVTGPDESVALLRGVLDGQPGAARDIVLLNAGVALYAAGVAPDIAAGIERARAAIDSGAAKAKLAQVAAFSQNPAGA